jgi:hypothetical protein
MYYMYHGTPYNANTGELSKYATLADVWTTGKRPRRPPWRSTAKGFAAFGAGWMCAAKAAPYQDLRYMCTATHGDGIYQLDAWPYWGSPNVFASTQKYNAQTDVWTSVRRIPTGRISGTDGSATAVTVESGIYVSGGYYPTTVGRTHEMYYPVVDIWTTKRALPTFSHNQAGGAWGSTVMLAGGYPYSNQFHRYSAVTDTWTSGECLLRLAPSVAIYMRSPAHKAWRASASVLLQASSCPLGSTGLRGWSKGTISTSSAVQPTPTLPRVPCTYMTATRGHGRQVIAPQLALRRAGA